MANSNYWVHDLDPFLFQFTENFGIRYYGLAYALGFLVGMWLLHLFCKHGKAALTPEQQSFTITAMMIGVLLGGRMGYMVFYALDETLRQPWVIFQVWKGGMASHGGFIGVLVACWCIADAGVAEPIWRLLHLHCRRSGIPACAKSDGCGRVPVSRRSPRRNAYHVRLRVHGRKEVLPRGVEKAHV